MTVGVSILSKKNTSLISIRSPLFWLLCVNPRQHNSTRFTRKSRLSRAGAQGALIVVARGLAHRPLGRIAADTARFYTEGRPPSAAGHIDPFYLPAHEKEN